jgi:hypothetical protein
VSGQIQQRPDAAFRNVPGDRVLQRISGSTHSHSFAPGGLFVIDGVIDAFDLVDDASRQRTEQTYVEG